VLVRWPDAKPFPVAAMRSELEKGDLETKHQFRRRLTLEITTQKTSLVVQPVRKLKRNFFAGAILRGSSPNIIAAGAHILVGIDVALRSKRLPSQVQ
jgi:hypothetical protein